MRNKINLRRCEINPLIESKDVKPTREDFKVDGVFNCGVTRYKDEVMLLCRVAESAKVEEVNLVKIPVVASRDGKDQIIIITIDKNVNKNYDYSDSRSISKVSKDGFRQSIYLTSLSHLRIAKSKDGINFKIDDNPFISPNSIEEEWGMEDPRITRIEDMYYINYTSVSRNGAASSLISTKDFINIERHGIIFAPENKDVTIFPEKINNKYIAFNRPVPKSIGTPDMWMAESPDLIHWGKQRHFCGASKEDSWENGRIGGGAVPFKTEKGWVKIYHAADKNNRYCLGAFLLDIKDPFKVIGKTKMPILQPETDYEKEGFFGNVVFTCGCLYENNIIKIYYGAADDKVCLAEVELKDVLNAMDIY